MAQPEQNAWIEKMLGFRISGRGGAREQPRPDPKLLQHWHQAHASAREAAQKIGQAVLALPEVQSDPRFSQAQDAVGMLPGWSPISAATRIPAETGSAQVTQADALALVLAYRQRIAAATELGNLERFASKHVGNFPVQSMLDDALAELEAGLKTAA